MKNLFIQKVKIQKYNKIEEKKKINKEEFITRKIHAAIWIVSSIILFFASNMTSIIKNKTDLNLYFFFLFSTFFYIGLVLIGVVITIVLYLIVFIPFVLHKRDVDWNIYCPKMIYALTFSSILAGISYNYIYI